MIAAAAATATASRTITPTTIPMITPVDNSPYCTGTTSTTVKPAAEKMLLEF